MNDQGERLFLMAVASLQLVPLKKVFTTNWDSNIGVPATNFINCKNSYGYCNLVSGPRK